jgi:3alpha(or 20beta)-hydroxysteroid dehydrogenase
MQELRGKVALVTGAAAGQGAAEARILAEHGATVIVADVATEKGEALAASLPGARFIRLDVAASADWDDAMTLIEHDHRRLDILVNNAAIAHFGTIETMPIDEFMRVQSINLGGVFLGMQRTLPTMKAAGGGVIVNVSSISGLLGRGDQPAYLASKWAVRGLTRAAAIELAPYGIRVNAIVPGLIATEMTLAAHGKEKLRTRGEALPVGRYGEPQDIAELLLFLVSSTSGFCTGSEFVCDGGETAAMRI